MRRAGRDWWLGLGLAAVLAVELPTAARAAVGDLWTLVGTPLAATTGTTIDFKLTATKESLLSSIGCIRIDTTTHFAVERADANHGWVTSGAGTQITTRSPSTGSALGLLGTLDLTVRATPLDPGAWSWSGTAYADLACGGSPLPGLPLVSIVVSGPAVTPSPAPTPTSSPPPTPTSSPPPTLGPSPPPTRAPTPEPSSTPAPAGTATTSASAHPAASPPATPPTAEPSPSTPASRRATLEPATTGVPVPAAGRQGDAGGGPPGSGNGGGPGSDREPDEVFAVRPSSTRIDFARPAALAALHDLLEVAAPTLVLAIPGLLILLAVAAQAIGGLAWIPVVRRQLGDRRRSRRVRFIRRPT